MIKQVAPVFFAIDIPGTLAYYQGKLGFACFGTWQDPPTYAIVARDQHAIHFRCAPTTPNPNKYAEELLDAYLFVEDADALYAEYAAKGVEFARELGDTLGWFLGGWRLFAVGLRLFGQAVDIPGDDGRVGLGGEAYELGEGAGA